MATNMHLEPTYTHTHTHSQQKAHTHLPAPTQLNTQPIWTDVGWRPPTRQTDTNYCVEGEQNTTARCQRSAHVPPKLCADSVTRQTLDCPRSWLMVTPNVRHRTRYPSRSMQTMQSLRPSGELHLPDLPLMRHEYGSRCWSKSMAHAQRWWQ